ncbi:MAG: heme ABC transporter permease [Alphaproteobacteria bacterium]|nr:heme ABC transporter permease [Alphaproteobacteria bacterium]
MHRFANPARFGRIIAAILPWGAGASVLLLALGLYLALFVVPPDYQQKETVRIMFVHVPAAWMATMIYAVMALASAVALVWKHPVADLSAKAAAPIGAGFTFVALATGSLWGQPMWGSWWVWDARLTSVLILFFLYLGYIALWEAIDDPARAAKAAAILALVGAVNVPIIKFSVDWWNTLHQPASILKLSGSTIHASMLYPLLVMIAGFTAFFVTVLIIRMQRELAARRVRALALGGSADS